MSYKLNLTDGSLLLELIDGKIDNTSTDLTFIGKNYQGFGEVLNENFIKLLENFNNTVAPTAPIQGQLWYDRVTGRLKIYDGSVFRNTDNTEFESSQPSERLAGDFWINSQTDQLYFFNGVDYVLVGPKFTKVEGKNGYFAETVISKEDGQNKVVAKLFVNGAVVAIVSKDEFTPVPSILGFTTIKAGFNISALYPNFNFNGTASTALNIQDADGNVFDTDSFLKTTPPGFSQSTDGVLHINNDNGLIIGTGLEFRQRVNASTMVQETTTQNLNYKLDLRDGNGVVNGIFIDNSSDTKKLMGIFTDGPQDLSPTSGDANVVDINADVRIAGDLRIQGDQLYVDTQSLRVQDYQIELGVSEDSTIQNDSAIDEAGIVVKSSDGDKDWVWVNATTSWTSSEHINLKTNDRVYKIAGAEILSSTALGASVTSAPGLTELGSLTELQVDQLNFNNDTITASNDLNIVVPGNLVFSPAKTITGVLDPTQDNQAANKAYVDAQLSTLPVILSADITGLGVDYEVESDVASDTVLINNVITMLEQIAPPGDYLEGTIARVLATRTEYSAYSLDLVGTVGATKTITAATQANPVVVTTSASHGYNDGDEIIIFNVVGMTALNNERYYVRVVDATNIELYLDSTLTTSVDGTAYSAYTSDGEIAPASPVFEVTVEAFDAGGTLNKNAVTAAGHIAETEVEITTTITRSLIYFEEAGSQWVHQPSLSRNDILA